MYGNSKKWKGIVAHKELTMETKLSVARERGLMFWEGDHMKNGDKIINKSKCVVFWEQCL